MATPSTVLPPGHAVRRLWPSDQPAILAYFTRLDPETRANRFMGAVRVPTLVLAALDDPWIPGRLYQEYDWLENRALTPVLSASGGHVGFHGRGSRQPWSDLAIERFFERA